MIQITTETFKPSKDNWVCTIPFIAIVHDSSVNFGILIAFVAWSIQINFNIVK